MAFLEDLANDHTLDWNVNAQAMSQIEKRIASGQPVKVELTQTTPLKRLEYWSSNNNEDGVKLYCSQTFIPEYDADQPLPLDPTPVGDPNNPMTSMPGTQQSILYGVGHPMQIVGVSMPNGELDQDQFTYTLHLISELGTRQFYHEMHDACDQVSALYFPDLE